MRKTEQILRCPRVTAERLLPLSFL